MKTKLRSILFFAAAALLLSACRVVVNTDVKADGSGQLDTAVVFTAKEREDFESKPENQGKGICDGIEQGVSDGATFVEEIREGETYCTTERSFKNLDELRSFYTGMNQVKVNTLQLEMGKMTFDVEVDLTNDDNGGGLENEWKLTLPGGISENNADRVEGQTLIWMVSPGEKAQLHAESMVTGQEAATPPEATSTGMLVVILIIVGLILVLLVGTLLTYLVMRRSRT